MNPYDRLERYRDRYAGLVRDWRHATVRYERCVADCLAPGARVLDLGCGRGGIVERLGGCGRWIGVDPDGPSLREHRVAALPRGQARSRRLPFADQIFDLVVTSWVFEHLPDPARTFAEIARVLKPGGQLVFLTPNGRHPIPRVSRAVAQLTRMQARIVAGLYGRSARDTFPVHYRANTFEQIDRLAAGAGLHLREVVFVDDPSYWAADWLPFGLAVALEAALPDRWKVHLVGVYRRSVEVS